jgi:hypothetical protein
MIPNMNREESIRQICGGIQSMQEMEEHLRRKTTFELIVDKALGLDGFRRLLSRLLGYSCKGCLGSGKRIKGNKGGPQGSQLYGLPQLLFPKERK